MADPLRISWFDRLLINIAPKWGLERVRARAAAQVMARNFHFDATGGGRRTDGWPRYSTDANAANGPAIRPLRDLSRDLRRNNGWARRAVEVIANNTVGWGIMPKPSNRSAVRAQAALDIWNAWADSTSCDHDGRLNFYGLQALAMETIVESGEVVIVRHPAPMSDGLPIPMRIQVLEPDYLDHTRNGIVGPGGGPIYDGVEFDKQGRRVAYWLYTSHPGGMRLMTTRFESVRVPAENVLHVYRVERPGQVRGVPWLAAAITRLKDYDEFEDAELMQQKVAACFGAFVKDMDGAVTALGGDETDSNGNKLDQLEPGHIEYLPPGRDVSFATPPATRDSSFSVRTLRRIAVTMNVTYEDISGDYSQVNFSSARMARLSHWASVEKWREHMIIPQLCQGVWGWAMQYAATEWPSIPIADWSCPPMPILEPDKEGLAWQRLLRIGAKTWPQMVRELGNDPTAQLKEIADWNADADAAGVVLDSDPRKMTSAGQQQALPAGDAADDGDGSDAEDAADEATDASKSTH